MGVLEIPLDLLHLLLLYTPSAYRLALLCRKSWWCYRDNSLLWQWMLDITLSNSKSAITPSLQAMIARFPEMQKMV